MSRDMPEVQEKTVFRPGDGVVVTGDVSSRRDGRTLTGRRCIVERILVEGGASERGVVEVHVPQEGYLLLYADQLETVRPVPVSDESADDEA